MTENNKPKDAIIKRYDRTAPVYDLMEILAERFSYSHWRKLLWSKVEGKNILEIVIGTEYNTRLLPLNHHRDA